MINANHILIADDDADFVMLLKAAFEEIHTEICIDAVEDSVSAQKYLTNEPPYNDESRYSIPGLIVLDLRLPPQDGLSLLGWIRREPQLDGLPVVILTGAELPNLEETAVQIGANGYYIKPFQFTKLVGLVQQLRDTWLRHDEAVQHQSRH